MNFAQFQTEDRRLTVLMALAASAQYRANAYLVRQYCASVGHSVSHDRIEQDIAWLVEQGLAKHVGVGVVVAEITTRGLDVAQGLVVVPGVKQPLPGA